MKKVWKGVILAMLLSAIFVVVKNECGRYLMCHANSGVQPLITASKNGRYQDGINLFAGSSMFRKGLEIHTLESRFGENTYILSYNGTCPFQLYEEVRYAVNKNVIINHLYVDLYAFSLANDPWVEDSRLFLDTDFSFKIELWKCMSAYSDNYLKNLWEMFVTANNDRLWCWPVDYAITNAQFYKGGYLLDDAGNGVSSATKTPKIPKIEVAQINSCQELYLRKLCALCREENISLTFLETPKYQTTAYSAYYVSLMRAYLDILNEEGVDYILSEDSAKTCAKEVTETENCVAVIAFDSSIPLYYMDEIHLSGEGRRSFSHSLVNAYDEKVEQD